MWTSFMDLLQRLEKSQIWGWWLLVCPFIWMVMCIRLEWERHALAVQREYLRKCGEAMDQAIKRVAAGEPSLEELRDNDEKVRKIHTRGHLDCPACEAVKFTSCFSEGEDEYYRRIRERRLAKQLPPKGDDPNG